MLDSYKTKGKTKKELKRKIIELESKITLLEAMNDNEEFISKALLHIKPKSCDEIRKFWSVRRF